MSWGTRETTKTPPNETESFVLKRYLLEIFKKSKSGNNDKQNLNILLDSIKKFENQTTIISETKQRPTKFRNKRPKLTLINHHYYEIDEKKQLNNWIDHFSLFKFEKRAMNKNEIKFFEQLIEKHLYPLKDLENKEQIIKELKDLRNRCCFAFFMLNGIWISVLFSLNILQANLKENMFIAIPLVGAASLKYEPISFLFVILFVVVILLQFIAMLWHRAITFIQLIRNAKSFQISKNIPNGFQK